MSILQDLLNLLFGIINMSDQVEDFTLVLDPVVDEALQSVSPYDSSIKIIDLSVYRSIRCSRF